MGTWARVVTESAQGVISQSATGVEAVANNSTDETVYLTFVDGATGTQGIETDTGLSYNPSSGILTTTSVAGNVSGSSGSCTGNAATATALSSTDNIAMTGDVTWNVDFGGSGNVTADGTIGADKVHGTMINSDAGGTGITVSGDAINIDAAQPTVSSIGPAGTLTVNQDLTVTGDFIVNGATVQMEVEELLVRDKIISLANVSGTSLPNTTTADSSGVQIETYAPADGIYSLNIASHSGTGYSAGTWTTSGGGGVDAEGAYGVSGGVVQKDSFTVTNHGSGYTSVPSITLSSSGGGNVGTITAVLGSEARNPSISWHKDQGALHTDGTGANDSLTGWALTNAASTARTKIPIAVMQFGDSGPGDTDGEGIGTFHFEGDVGTLYIRTS